MFELWQVVNENLCASKSLNKFQTFEVNYKISKERRISIASVVGLDNLSSNLRIIKLRSITYSPGHNSLELHNILIQSRFITSKRKLDI